MKQPTKARSDEPHEMFDISEKVGNVRYFNDGPHPDRKWFLGDSVEERISDGCVISVGTIQAPTAEELALPHNEDDLFVQWDIVGVLGRRWTSWKVISPRY